jgi:hypothetical protein
MEKWFFEELGNCHTRSQFGIRGDVPQQLNNI